MDQVVKSWIDFGVMGLAIATLLVAVGFLARELRSARQTYDDFRTKREERDLTLMRDQIETNRRVADALAQVSQATCAAIQELEDQVSAITGKPKRRVR